MRKIKIFVELETEQYQSIDNMADLVRIAIRAIFFIDPKIKKIEVTEDETK